MSKSHGNATTPTRIRSTTQWASRHNVISALVPFEHRNVDVVAELDALRKAIEQLPPTASSFTLGNLDNYRDDGRLFTRPTSTTGVTTLLAIQGALPHEETVAKARYLNPEYVHDTPFASSRYSDRERVQIVRRAARLGTLDHSHLAAAFGFSPSRFRTWCHERGIPWLQWRQTGRVRLARTLRLIQAWDGRSKRSTGQLLTRPTRTVTQWMEKYASDFDVPPKPSLAR